LGVGRGLWMRWGGGTAAETTRRAAAVEENGGAGLLERRRRGRGGDLQEVGRRAGGTAAETTRRSGGLRRREGGNELGFVPSPPPVVAYILLQPAVGLLAGRGGPQRLVFWGGLLLGWELGLG
jgi:hypothetical protein